MVTALWALALLGCTADDPSHVGELRVAAVVAEPPELVPGGRVELETWILDPTSEAPDLLVWFCSLHDGACVEAYGGRRTLADWARVVRGPTTSAQTRVVFDVPADVQTLLPLELDAVDVTLWALACAPGVCPIVDQVGFVPPPGSPDYLDVVDQLSRPQDWLAELPIDQTSLAVKRLIVSNRDAGLRNRNPEIVVISDVPERVEPGRSVPFRILSDAQAVYPMATRGGFGALSVGPAQGEAVAVWEAPDQEGGVRILLVAEDGQGGSAVWETLVQVQAP